MSALQKAITCSLHPKIPTNSARQRYPTTLAQISPTLVSERDRERERLTERRREREGGRKEESRILTISIHAVILFFRLFCCFAYERIHRQQNVHLSCLQRELRGIEFVRTESPRVRLCIDGCPSQLLPDSPSIVTLSECILLLRALECVFSTCVMDGALFCTPLPLPLNPSFSPSAFDSFITSFYSAPIKVSDSSSAVVQI